MKNVIDGTCSMHEVDDKCTHISVGKREGKKPSEDVGIDGW
jgi:hypothetical protein